MTIDDVLENLCKDLDKHYGISDFGCKECYKIVAKAKSALLEIILGSKPKKRKCICDNHLYNICNCGWEEFNQGCDEYEKAIEELFK